MRIERVLRELAKCFAIVTLCTRQAQRNDSRKCSTFPSLIESWEDMQVSQCSLHRAWEKPKESKKRERKREVCRFACVSAYLTNDKRDQSLTSRNGEHRGGRKEGRETGAQRWLPYIFTHCRWRAMMKWWQKQNETKTNSANLWLKVFLMYLFTKILFLAVCKVTLCYVLLLFKIHTCLAFFFLAFIILAPQVYCQDCGS